MKTCINDEIKVVLIILLIAMVGFLSAAWTITVERTAPLLEPRPFPPSYPGSVSFRGDLEVFT